MGPVSYTHLRFPAPQTADTLDCALLEGELASNVLAALQDQPALGKGKIHLPHHKGVVNRGQQLAAAGIPQLYGGAATILLNGHQTAPCPVSYTHLDVYKRQA